MPLNDCMKKQDSDLQVSLAEEVSDVKTVTYYSKRWEWLVEILSQVNETVNQSVSKQYIILGQHLEGKWYMGSCKSTSVSATSTVQQRR